MTRDNKLIFSVRTPLAVVISDSMLLWLSTVVCRQLSALVFDSNMWERDETATAEPRHNDAAAKKQ